MPQGDQECDALLPVFSYFLYTKPKENSPEYSEFLYLHGNHWCGVQDIAPSLPDKDCSHISIRPTMFVDVLTTRFGFQLVGRRHVRVAATGFNRPLIILRKPELS